MRWGGGIVIAGLLAGWHCVLVSGLGLERPWSIVAYAAAIVAAAWIGWRSAHRRVTFFDRRPQLTGDAYGGQSWSYLKGRYSRGRLERQRSTSGRDCLC